MHFSHFCTIVINEKSRDFAILFVTESFSKSTIWKKQKQFLIIQLLQEYVSTKC